MLCDRCKQNQATVHTVTIMNGAKQEYYLCEDCAKGAQFTLPSLMDVLGGFYAVPQAAAQPACACGGSLGRFQETGLLGCPDCYITYRRELSPVIKRAQGGRLRHVGRRPIDARGAAPAAEGDALGVLKTELAKAIAAEEYERAAELRDRIRQMEG